jgi:hypothetical protein
VAVVAVEAPGLQHAVGVAVFARPADVIHDFVPPVFDNRPADALADIGERFVPRHLPPLAGSALAVAAERVEDSIGIFELVGCDDAFRARAPATARMERVALDLADGELFLVDIGQDPARRFAVEADARDNPVVPPILLRPARRLEVDEVVPGRRIGVRSERSHFRLQIANR